jgi:hypothetical protein
VAYPRPGRSPLGTQALPVSGYVIDHTGYSPSEHTRSRTPAQPAAVEATIAITPSISAQRPPLPLTREASQHRPDRCLNGRPSCISHTARGAGSRMAKDERRPGRPRTDRLPEARTPVHECREAARTVHRAASVAGSATTSRGTGTAARTSAGLVPASSRTEPWVPAAPLCRRPMTPRTSRPPATPAPVTQDTACLLRRD